MFCLMFSQIWQAALGALNPNPTDSCPLYLNHAAVAAVPSRVSRHNSPSSAHFVSRLVRSCLPGGNNRCIVVSISILRILYVAAYQLIVIPVWGIFFPGALKATEQICGFIILWLLVEILWPSASSRGNVPSDQVADMSVFFLSRWCASVQMCSPPPVPSPGPSPSSLAAPHPHAGLRRSTSLWSL